MIKLQNVYKEYQLDREVIFTALKNINFTVNQGEFSAIMGPSGSGKSTLMHIIGLLDKPTKGKVFINTKEILKLNDDELSTLRNEFVGFVFQQFNLIPKLTVEENILLPTIYARKNLSFDPAKKAREIMKKFGIDNKANSYPNKISGGQQQRVAIARALIMSPKLILADEPTGNLDTKTGDQIIDLLEDLNQNEKLTVLIVTHETNIAKKTKRIIKIKDGEIQT
ncbi:ABC transporter ATP-binding protein [Candidatus Roizmanbacteria bacterium]|nr:ABC transporter ATP-binding protein [Candidatus Roizmanbacteria bacterium]